MRFRLRVKPLVFGVAAAVLVTAAVWFYASELNRGGACSVGSLETLLVLPPSTLQGVDIGRMNLLCAEGLPGADGFGLEAGLVKLDEMAARYGARLSGTFTGSRRIQASSRVLRDSSAC